MPVLLLSFPGRRYHATPWGHHVNEGLIEWPPSPWRLLRALLAVGYSALGWEASSDEPWHSRPPAVAQSLIAKLAGTLPHYHLPAAMGTHSRHYMPLGVLDKHLEKKTLVFDTWAQIARGELGIRWDVSLDEAEWGLLDALARNLSYLGRSESWVVARLLRDEDVADLAFDVRPGADLASPGPGWDEVALLAPMVDVDFAPWRAAQVEQALQLLPAPEGGKRIPAVLARKRAAAQQPFPASILACLQTDTTWQRGFGWSQPPGSRKVLYWRRSDSLASLRLPLARSEVAERSAAAAASPRVPFVLLALATRSGNRHALPVLARSLPQGEMLHRQMVAARLKLAPGVTPRVLGGCRDDGRPLDEPHRHAHALSLDLDCDGHIDHLLVWAPAGLDGLDQRALRMTRGTYSKGGVDALRLAWAGSGAHVDLCAMAEPFGTAMRAAIGSHRAWLSATPFVPPRHLKARGRHTLAGQVQAELAVRGLPPAASVEALDPHRDEHARQLRLHVRRRGHGPAPVIDHGFTLRLTFSEPIGGPLCLGYGSHFGLGRFAGDDLV
jgi:CRISPR-associated protein Csb2